MRRTPRPRASGDSAARAADRGRRRAGPPAPVPPPPRERGDKRLVVRLDPRPPRLGCERARGGGEALGEVGGTGFALVRELDPDRDGLDRGRCGGGESWIQPTGHGRGTRDSGSTRASGSSRERGVSGEDQHERQRGEEYGREAHDVDSTPVRARLQAPTSKETPALACASSQPTSRPAAFVTGGRRWAPRPAASR